MQGHPPHIRKQDRRADDRNFPSFRGRGNEQGHEGSSMYLAGTDCICGRDLEKGWSQHLSLSLPYTQPTNPKNNGTDQIYLMLSIRITILLSLYFVAREELAHC